MFSLNKLVWVLGTLLVAVPVLERAAQAQSYTITDMGTLPGGDSYQPLGINAGGQAAGSAALLGSDLTTEVNHAVVFGSGPLRDIGTLGGDNSEAAAINNSGQVVGKAAVYGDMQHAFVYAGDAMTDLGVLDGDTQSEAAGINAQGQIVGTSYSDQGRSQGVLFDGGALVPIGPFPLGTYSALAAINDSGRIAGSADNAGGDQHAFVYANGMMTDLGTLPGGTFSEAHGINAGGQVVGIADTPSTNFHAFLYDGHAMNDLGALPGATYSDAVAINAGGQVVGHSDTGPNTTLVPVLFSSGRVTDINTLLPAGSGWTLDNVSGINDSGQIVGAGHNPQGYARAFLLTPRPNSRFDFDGDGSDDVLWHNTRTGQTLVWNMNDQSVNTYGNSFATAGNTDWTVAAVGDVNGDGHPDLLWQNRRTGDVLFWLMGGTTGGANGQQVLSYGNPFATVPDTHWRVVSLADFNGDGHPDILWQNSATDQLVIWTMNGTSVIGYGDPFATVSDTRWQVVGTADFNSDGHPDLLWENSATGAVVVWNLGGPEGKTVLNYGGSFATVPNTAWHIVGTGDMDGDAHPDLLWQNTQTGQLVRWLLGGADGTTVQAYGGVFATVPDTHWQISGVH